LGINKISLKYIVLCCCFFFCNLIISQETGEKHHDETPTSFYKVEIRGNNVISAAIGTAVLNGDFPDPIFEIEMYIGYKRFFGSYVNLNLGYHKFNLANKDEFNLGFMSFDLNLELNISPHHLFTPFVYAGGGLNASNYFKKSDTKVQTGGGIEYLATKTLGLKLFGEYNYVFSDELDGKISGDANDTYWRMGFGINFYFGKGVKRKKINKNVPTVINSNPIKPYKN